MSKIVLYIAGLALLFTPAFADEVVILESPPTYGDGESHEGLFFDESGTLMFHIRQHATNNVDGVHVYASLEDAEGNVITTIVANQANWHVASMGLEGASVTVETTCSNSGLYPITSGKIYECTMSTSTNGMVVHEELRLEYEEMEAKDVGTSLICKTHVYNSPGKHMKLRACDTPDGKWSKFVQMLEYQEKHAL